MKLPHPFYTVVALCLVACGGAAVAAPAAITTGGPMTARTTAGEGPSLPTAAADVQRLTELANHDGNLAPWSGPYGGVPPWDKLDAATFGKSFELGMALMLAEVAVIADNPEAPTFANTMLALEDSGRHLTRALTLFGVMTSNLNEPDVQAVDAEWSPKLTAAYDKVTFNEKLFARLQALYEARATSGLDAVQQRLVQLQFERFVRQGAKLSAADKSRVGALNEQLASLFTEFGNKVLADENTWTLLEHPSDLLGLTESLTSALKTAAEQRGLDGKWAVVNTRSSVDPFLTSASRRDLREKVYKAFKNRGDNGDANDTKQVITQIVSLRAKRAKLLGYANHAKFRMDDTMAKDPKQAEALMLRVWPAAVARVREEVSAMTRLAKRDGLTTPFEPWDYLYYAEKVRKAKYNLNQDELTPYFELNNMVAAAFWMAERLYGLSFKEITGQVPVFLPEVRVWEVTDKSSGAHVGLFYGDYFARPAKSSGAWASGYRSREAMAGEVITPIRSNNNNFVKGAASDPVLISLDDSETLFHEFGHALHGLVSEVKYPTLANVPRDFVEYPSQVHEQWVMSEPVLKRFAKHHKTGKPMPKSLVDKVAASSRFNTGYRTVEYLSSAIVDMALHALSSDEAVDPGAFERDTLQRIGAPREVAMRHRLPHFNHLFTSDAYSAGYYSYLWSEVMDADTREAFAETKDIFDPTVAAKLRRFILAPGNSTDRAEAYRQFRGRDPDVAALVKKRGFPSTP